MKTKRLFLPCLLSLGLMATARAHDPSPSPAVEDTSFTAPDGTRVLQHSIVVPATLAEVWTAFTTTEGVRSWAVPVAQVDFRLGGIWESSYKRDAKLGEPGNIRNRYLAYLPMEMVTIQAISAPPTFPHPELLPELFTVIEMRPLGPREVRVRVSQVGYKTGPGYDAIYAHFQRGNPWSLQKLQERFTRGPVDWEALLAPTPQAAREK